MRRLLWSRRVHVDNDRDISRAEVLARLFFKKEHLLPSSISHERRIKAHTLHDSGPIMPVDVEFSQTYTNMALGNNAAQS